MAPRVTQLKRNLYCRVFYFFGIISHVGVAGVLFGFFVSRIVIVRFFFSWLQSQMLDSWKRLGLHDHQRGMRELAHVHFVPSWHWAQLLFRRSLLGFWHLQQSLWLYVSRRHYAAFRIWRCLLLESKFLCLAHESGTSKNVMKIYFFFQAPCMAHPVSLKKMMTPFTNKTLCLTNSYICNEKGIDSRILGNTEGPAFFFS